MVIKQWNQVLVENATASVFERDEIVFLLRVAIVAAAKKHTEEQNTTVKKKKSKKVGKVFGATLNNYQLARIQERLLNFIS